jgi:hypothetical protein
VYRERKGLLLIADISGYTEYLESTELAHAQGIISDVLETLIDAGGEAFEVAKLEGGAVFFLGEGQRLRPDGLRDGIWRVFDAFHGRQAAITSTNTCRCRGCVCACKLGIKFVAHHGSFGEHTVHGLREVIGPEVILVHRLLKNTIGLREYAAFTVALLERWGEAAPPVDRRHLERCEHIGTVELGVWNLDSQREPATA